jgi:hypothetical protein
MKTTISKCVCFILAIACGRSTCLANYHSLMATPSKTNRLMVLELEPGSSLQAANGRTAVVLVQAGNPFGEDPFAEPSTTPPVESIDPFGSPEVIAPPTLAPPTPVQPRVTTPEVNNFPSAGPLIAPPPVDLLDETSNYGSLLARELELRQAAAQALEQDVRNQLVEAQRLMRQNPSAVRVALKARLDELERAVDLDPTTRALLLDRVRAAIQTASIEEGRYLDRIQRAETVRAQADASQRLIAEMNRTDESLKQLVEQFNYLLSQRRYLEASKDVAPEVGRLAPGTPLESVIREGSSLLTNYAIVREAFEAREQGFVDAMRGVEVAAIPLDEPPIVYPPPEVWQAVSARRRERYGAVNLAGGSKAEQKITAALKQTAADIDFQNEPLNRIMDTLQDAYNVPIRLNTVELGLVGVDPDTPVNIKLPPVSLRSALRQILAEIDIADLTYTIRDEVLLITSQEDADDVPQVKVYPVGDLVVTPMMLQMAGGMGGGMMGGMGGMGGGMGGMGGGMGGMGGGMGGMGGGMGGMGGGMGGMGGGMGGMFAVPDNAKKQ